MIAKLLPLLNRLVPTALAAKGLTKLNPTIGRFITNAAAAGYATDSILDFLREQYQETNPDYNLRPDERAAQAAVQRSHFIPNAAKHLANTALGTGEIYGASQILGNMFGDKGQPQGQEGQPQNQAQPRLAEGLQDQIAPQLANFIAQFSPDLDSFIKQQIKAGRSPFEAGALARAQGFEKVIQDMEKATKFKFSDILARIFGGQPPQEQGMGPAQAPQQAAQAGQGDQMLSAAIDKLMKLL